MRLSRPQAIAVGATVEVTLVVRVGSAAYPSVANTAVVTTPTEQLPTAVPSDTATVTVLAKPLAGTGIDASTLAVWFWFALGLLVLGTAIVLVRLQRRRS